MKQVFLVPMIGALLIGAPANAVITVYNNDEAGFLAAAGGVVLEDFNSAVPDSIINTGPPTSIGSVTIEHIGSDGNTFMSIGSAANNIDGTTHIDMFVGPEVPGLFPSESVVITLPFPVSAAGFEIADFFSSGASFGADVFAGADLAFNTLDEGFAGTNGIVAPGFIGFVSDSPFTTLTFSTTEGFGEAFGVDNLVYTPAPGAAALFSIAGAFARRRRR